MYFTPSIPAIKKITTLLTHLIIISFIPSVSFASFAADASAVEHTTVGRYLAISNQPLTGQKDLLQQTRQVTFPASIDTMESAIRYLLLFSGYSLESVSQMDSSAQTMLRVALPEIDRSFGPMSLQDGLETLSGESFTLLVDPIHRLVSFKLKPSYQMLYQTNSAGSEYPFIQTDQTNKINKISQTDNSLNS